MTQAERPPLWLPPISLVAIAFVIWMISFTPTWFCPDPLIPFRVTGQLLLLIIVLRIFCYWPPMVRWVASMPVPHRIIFALIIGGMMLGHYTLNSRKYFPYVAWEIFPFVNEQNPVTCREFIATTQSGRQVRLLAEQLFPSIVQIFPLDDPGHFPPETTDHLAQAMTHEYNLLHPDDPVRQVDLIVKAVQLHPPANESRTEPSCQLLKRYDFSSGQ
jgi:hypothetical protein